MNYTKMELEATLKGMIEFCDNVLELDGENALIHCKPIRESYVEILNLVNKLDK